MAADTYKDYMQQMADELYDMKKEKRLQELESAYQSDRSRLEGTKDELRSQLKAQKNELAAAYEKNRLSTNELNAAKGLSSGAASQAALSQLSEYQRNSTSLDAANTAASADAERRLAELEQQYKSDVASAIAENDYQKAAALMQQYKDNYQKQLSEAGLKANYGDFSGYSDIYGQDMAQAMYEFWKAKNPLLAYRAGEMTEQEYIDLVGKRPR